MRSILGMQASLAIRSTSRLGYDNPHVFYVHIMLKCVRGLTISLSPETISRMTTLPLWIQWSEEDKVVSVTVKNIFFIHREKLVGDKNGVRREILSYP